MCKSCNKSKEQVKKLALIYCKGFKVDVYLYYLNGWRFAEIMPENAINVELIKYEI